MILERRIIAGLIVSDDYLRRVAPIWSDDCVESGELRRIARWCLAYFAEHKRAPGRDIELVYLAAIRDDAVPKAEAAIIEDILAGVSDDYDRGDQFNSAYLFDQTVRLFRERELRLHNGRVQDLIDRGQLDEAEALQGSFRPRSWVTSRGLDLGTEPGYERVRAAFDHASEPVVAYPGPLGEMVNSHLIRDGFVAFLARDKAGKTMWLTDLAFRALRQRANVAFFQAGDLSESQMLRRIAVHLSRRSDAPRYCEPRWVPVGDCIKNQFDDCTRLDRNCDHGAFPRSDLKKCGEDPKIFQKIEVLIEAARAAPDYRPCDSATCGERWPCAWVHLVPEAAPLTGVDAEQTVRRFFERWRRRFRLACHSSGTLTADEIRSCIAEWERQDDFVPDVVVVDYADLMTSRVPEFRHRQDDIWRNLRGIAQERHALVLTATQADADSYRADLLSAGNFSEDKRKNAHVTAMFGLNQDREGREKDLGIVRVNTIVAREGAFNSVAVVHVLQDLAAGRPFLESFRVGRAPALPAASEAV